MKSKTSFFNMGIFLNNLKRHGWFGISYFIIMFFLAPLNVLMIYTTRSEELFRVAAFSKVIPTDFKNIFLQLSPSELQYFPMFIAPILLATILLRYMHVKKSAVVIHSLPVKRTTLFWTNFLTGFIFLTVPIVVNALVAIALRSFLGLEIFYSPMNVWYWAGITILFNLIFFSAATLVGMITGQSIAQVILTYIFLLLPIGLITLVCANLSYFIFGFTNNSTLNDAFSRLSPFVRVTEISNRAFTFPEVVGYVSASILFCWLALYFYNKWKVEAAGQSIAFQWLKPIFKYGVTLCSMLLGGAYFGGALNHNGWIFFGYFIGSIVGYIVAEVILKKSLRIQGAFKGYIVFLAVALLVIVGIKFDVTGFERRVPDLNQVQAAYFSTDDYYFAVKVQQQNELNSPLEFGLFNNHANIAKIQELQKTLIQDRESIQSELQNSKYKSGQNSIHYCIAYRLKDGSEIVRTYNIPLNRYNTLLKPIYESEEYRKIHNKILSIDIGKVQKITINSYEGNKRLAIISPSEIKEAIVSLQNDAHTITYEQMINQRPPWGTIVLLLDNNRMIEIPWNKGYSHFDEWLSSKNYLNQARLVLEDIDVIEAFHANMETVIRSQEAVVGRISKQLDPDESLKNLEKMTITNRKQIEQCLSTYQSINGQERYVIRIYANNKSILLEGSYTDENVPEFIRQFFQK